MRTFAFFVFLGCCLTSISAFAQTPKAIEKDLSNSFAKIYYWFDKAHNDTTEMLIAENDSLEIANDVFGNKLKYYTSNYPMTISRNFNIDMNVVTSTDHMFRIYSWDTEMGGTEHDYRNVMQYKNGKSVSSILNMDTTVSNDDHYVYYFSNIYTLKVGEKTYYLGIYNGVFSMKDMQEGVQIFRIESGKLNTHIKLIKTASGLHNTLSYVYDYFSIPSKLKDAEIHYNPASETLTLPVVGASDKIGDDEKVSTKHITYKFTGKYFEKVKN